MDDNTKTQIVDSEIHTMKINSDWMYYTTPLVNTGKLENQMYKVNTDGTENIKLGDGCYITFEIYENVNISFFMNW